MEIINALLQNDILIVGLISWFAAQVIKTVIYAAVNRELRFERLMGDGGMPSAHSATVTSVALSAGFTAGWASPVFAVAAILAIVVMHDAMGVRRETGKQAQVINSMMLTFEQLGAPDIPVEVKLKELVGHSPLQVFFGMLLGVVVSLIYFLA
ncbi:MAG: divergent PAP2 family protein [Lachnospiraceae bacterium]|nr:divergent PAP2 family protein [Lachnospiraceae bacterium]